MNFSGVNHFFWIYDFTMQRRSDYPLLEQKLVVRSLMSSIY